MLTKIFKLSILIGILVNLLSLGITVYVNKYAQRLTVIEDSARGLALSSLELDSQVAVFRSSIFLAKDTKRRYVSRPDKVIYVTPSDVKSQVYSYKP